MASPREDLLARAVEHVAEHGVGEVTLRGLAAALGTSHRMLVYHFGSKEGLLVAVAREVESRQRAAMADLVDGGADPLAFWDRLADPALAPFERLFFELYGQALQGRPHAVGLLDGVVEDWLDPIAALAVRLGAPPEQARTDARLMVAVTRGMLLDLLATGDRAGARAAVQRFAELYGRGGGVPGTAGS